ncbi:MAG: hypothetical protein ACRYFZ_15885 [Janthinobacterium lividum]
MEVTRQLRVDRVTKTGLAPIMLTCWWDNQRLRLMPGEKCLPKAWDDKRQLLKTARPNSEEERINLVLERYTQAAEVAHREAQQAGQRLDKDQMAAAIRRHYAELAKLPPPGAPAELPPIPGLPAPLEAEAAPGPSAFELTYQQWVSEQSRRANPRSGLRLSKSYLDSLQNTLVVLREYAAYAGQPLTLLGMDRTFYVAFQEHFLGTRNQGINTFGKHVRALKNFLGWAEDQDLPVNPKYRRFEAPDVYQGADALSQAELLALAATRFDTPQAYAYVKAAFEAQYAPAEAGRARKNGTRRSQVDDYRIRERLRTLGLARDKLLQCCYFGLRISDANRLAPHNLKGELARVRAGKTQELCLIPYFDDDVFKPVALVEQYEHLRLPTCLPVVTHLSETLPQVAHLSGITRIHLTPKVGRKTFATLKIYQGVPRAQVMLATGHKTETSFNRYLGIDEQELIHSFRKTARRVIGKKVVADGGGLGADPSPGLVADSGGGLLPDVA